MPLQFMKATGLNEGLYKDIDVKLTAIMQDTDNEKNNDDKLVSKLFIEKKSKKYGEKTTGLTSFSDFEIVDEGEAAIMDDIQEGFSKMIEHRQFVKGFAVSAEMMEDGDLDTAKAASANFIRAHKRSRAKFAAQALAAEGATFAWGPNTVDKTTGDGQGLFATAHKGKKAGVATQSNVFTNAFGADDKMLLRLSNVGRNFMNDSGEQQGYDFDVIVIPGNTPNLEAVVKKVIRTDLQVGSNFNDVNVSKGLYQLVINHRWIAAAGSEPYILMSSEANKELMGSVFYDRTPLKVIQNIITKTHGMEYSGRFRASAGFYNWRHVIMGGASTGSTLT